MSQYKINNLLDILLEVHAMKARHQGIEIQPVEGDIDEYFGQVASFVDAAIQDAKNESLVMTDDQRNGIESILYAVETCLKKNDPKSIVQIIEKMRNSGDVMLSNLVESEQDHDDPRCKKLNHKYLWWDFTICLPKFECITGYAEISGSTMYMGNCKDAGWENCKCIPVGYPLALVIAMIGLVGILFAGPTVSTGTAAMMRSIALRLIPAT